MEILRKSREFDDGISSFWEDVIQPVRITPDVWKIPDITITLLGGIVATIFLAAQVIAFVLSQIVFPVLFWEIWLAWVILSILFSGEMGVRFRIWLNLEPVVFRRRDTIRDLSPISRMSTRVVFYALFAVEVGFWFWFQILKVRPAIYQEWVLESYDLEPILYANEQFYFYWWLLPVLSLAFAAAMMGFNQLPEVSVYLRKTRLIILVAGVVLPTYLTISFLVWWGEVFPSTFG